jgi:hypothetical protein
MSLPTKDPYSEIYTVRGKWWSLCDDWLIDPRVMGKDKNSQTIQKDWDEFENTIGTKVQPFLEKMIKGKYHPHTHAFIGIDAAKRAYGNVKWTFSPGYNASDAELPQDLLDKSFKRGSGEGKEYPIRPVIKRGLTSDQDLMPMEISVAEEDGDGTVPSRSGRAVKDVATSYFELARVGHEPAYKNENAHAQRAALYGIVKIAQRIKVVAGMAYT